MDERLVLELKAGIRRGSEGQGLVVSLQEGGDLCSQGIIQVRRDLWRPSNWASSPNMSKGLRLCKDFFSEIWICPRIAIPQLDAKALEFELFFLDASICDLYKAVKPVGLERYWALAVSACAIPETDLNVQGGVELGGL